MRFSTFFLAVAASMAAQTAVGFLLENFFPLSLSGGVDTPLERSAPLFSWNLVEYLFMAVLAGLLFHSLAIPGSKIQRGVYVGLTAGALASAFAFFSWMAEFDLPMSLFQRIFQKHLGIGLVAGVVHSLFWLKKRASSGEA